MLERALRVLLSRSPRWAGLCLQGSASLGLYDSIAVCDTAQVSPRAEPPVCRFQNFGKAQYAAKLREKVRRSAPARARGLQGFTYHMIFQDLGLEIERVED